MFTTQELQKNHKCVDWGITVWSHIEPLMSMTCNTDIIDGQSPEEKSVQKQLLRTRQMS